MNQRPFASLALYARTRLIGRRTFNKSRCDRFKTLVLKKRQMKSWRSEKRRRPSGASERLGASERGLPHLPHPNVLVSIAPITPILLQIYQRKQCFSLPADDHH